MNMVSDCSIIEASAGFRVEARDGEPVRVLLMPYCFQVVTSDSGKSVGLCDYPRLVRLIMSGLGLRHKGGNPNEGPSLSTDKPRAARSLRAGLHAQWWRLLKKVDPTVLAVQRAIFAATSTGYDVVTQGDFYTDRRTVAAVLRYRAAAIAAGNLNLLVELQSLKHLGPFRRGDPTPFVASPHEDADVACLGLEGVVFDPVECMRDWRALFSYSGETYRNLNQTLECLPRRVPGGWVCILTGTRLERPVFDGLELLLLIIYSTLSGSSHKRDVPNAHIFAWARRHEILEAMQMIGEYARSPLSPNRSLDVYTAAEFLEIFPERHNGNIVGLAEKAIAWHRHELGRESAAVI